MLEIVALIAGIVFYIVVGTILAKMWIRKSLQNVDLCQSSDDMIGRNHYKGGMAQFNISGRSFRGQNITITNDRIIIDGKDVTDEYEIKPAGILEIKITEGVVENLTTDANVSAGSISGNVDAGGNVSCGSVGGNVDAGGNVSCGTVGGDVDAGGNVRHG
jgi:hypothetical protein